MIAIVVFTLPRFLDILAARKDPAGLLGEVLVDRAPQPPNFKCLSGYVVQVPDSCFYLFKVVNLLSVITLFSFQKKKKICNILFIILI